MSPSCLISTGVNIRPMPPIKCPPWASLSQLWLHMVGKPWPALEKHTSQLSLLIQQCMGSVRTYACGYIAGAIKCNRPSAVFQHPYPVIY